MKCDYCDLKNWKNAVIYDDDEVVVTVKETGLVPGQIMIFPAQHCTILEMVPDDILEKCIRLANMASIAVFESLGAQGTNIIVQNGTGAGQQVPHFALSVIPRRENDALPLSWKPLQLLEEEMDTPYLLLKEEGEKLVDLGKKKEKKKVVVSSEKPPLLKGESKNNYLLKSLRRMP